MKKLLIIALTLSIPIGVASAEILKQDDMAQGTSGELLVKGLSSLNEYGLYRIDDMGSGYHVYILTTRSGSQIHTVPIRKEN